MKRKLLFIIIAIVSFANTLFAYDVVGHRIVADVAYRNLTEKARSQVDKVLGKRGIIYTSSWADEIKSDKSYDYSYVWHYQNLKAGMGNSDLQRLLDNPASNGEHLFLAMQNMITRLKKNKNDQEALKFLVHLTGDLHQPLHLGRPEDLGGNKVMFEWFGRQMNIHQIWDGQLIDSRKMSSSEYAQYLEDKFEKQKRGIKSYTIFDSVKASYVLANSIYNYDMSDTNSYHYIYRFMNDLDIMLYRGGIQLANILNDIYK
ncbi:MAG: nuclease [Bacteroidetes bacterium]|nr:nuclease [Bacteroidota bacterium]